MSFKELRAADIEVFSSAICDYFEVVSGEKAQVRSAYLLEAEAPVLWNDYQGVIALHDGFVGTVCFSAPKALLTHILMLMGQGDYDDDTHLDLVGEIANTLAGQARRHFGEKLEISTPVAFTGRNGKVLSPAHSQPYAIPFTWRGYHAGLVVNLDPAAD